MFGTTLLLALRSIRRHLLRSFLTVLGIVIGVAAVVTMVTLGNATTADVQSQIASLGTNILQIRPGQGFGRGGGGPRPPNFELADVEAIEQQVAGVTAVAPQVQSSGTAIFEGTNWSTTINGTTNAYFTVQPWPLAEGRTFLPAEEQAGKAVCIIGNTVRQNLFRGGAAIGQRFRIRDISCDVIGVLSTRGQAGFGGDQDDVVIMPIKTVQRRFTGNQDVSVMLVGVDEAYSTAQVQASISEILRERRNITPGKDDNFNIFDTKQISDTLTGTTTLLTGIVTAVAAISLIVGGIGIMNIMLASMNERIREIGIRMAIGAKQRDILLQFLAESVTLSLLGGCAGIVFGLAAGFSIATGLFFGYYPARKASQLDPIEALRQQ